MSLKSKREIMLGTYATPLTMVKGLLESYEVVDRSGMFAKEGDKDVILKITNIEKLESDTPYPYKTAAIRVKFSDSATSGWCMLEDSIAESMGIPVEKSSIDDVVSKTIVMEVEKSHLYGTDKEGKELKGDVWRIMEVEGSAKTVTDTLAYALELYKKIGDKDRFEAAALQDPKIRKNPTLVSEILGGQFYKKVAA